MLFHSGPKISSNGFSLVEIILVTAFAGLVLLVIANIPSSIGLIGSSGYESKAKQIASQAIEDTRSKTYPNLSTNMPNGAAVIDSRITKLPNGSAKIYIDICPIEICPNNEEAYQVKVDVSWKDRGNPKSISLTTLVANGGLH